MTAPAPVPSPEPEDLLATARQVAAEFAISGALVDLHAHRRGHIHDTFVSTWDQGGGRLHRFLHQRLNQRVFQNLDALMHNIEVVTRHVGEVDGADDGLHALHLVPSRRGASFLRGPRGAWRCYDYVDGTESMDRCDSPARAREAARAFGAFQARLATLDPRRLHDTIPDFFSAPARFRQLELAAAANKAGRAAAARGELEFARVREPLTKEIERRLAAGAFPARIVHGDTKLNNVLFAQGSGHAVCVVDLDTVMPAWSLYDFGDLVRFTAATCAEDEREPGRAGVDLGLYRALVDGYLSSAGAFLTGEEVVLMPLAARLVTFTIGLRFLADYLNGDVYFKVARPNHNLERARVQFAMVAFMEQRADDMAVRR